MKLKSLSIIILFESLIIFVQTIPGQVDRNITEEKTE